MDSRAWALPGPSVLVSDPPKAPRLHPAFPAQTSTLLSPRPIKGVWPSVSRLQSCPLPQPGCPQTRLPTTGTHGPPSESWHRKDPGASEGQLRGRERIPAVWSGVSPVSSWGWSRLLGLCVPQAQAASLGAPAAGVVGKRAAGGWGASLLTKG